MLLANDIYTLIKSAEMKVFTKNKLQFSKITKTASACCTDTIAIYSYLFSIIIIFWYLKSIYSLIIIILFQS